MFKRRVKFIWGASGTIRGTWYLGLFGLYDRVEGERESGLAISLRGLLAWSAVGAAMAYIAAAAALFWVWQRNPYSVLTYADALLYPIRRGAISEKKGQAFIAQGHDLYRAKKYHEAANLLRLGLARFPRDIKARLTLAQYYVLTNQRPMALRWLQEGLTDEFPGRPYLETLFNVAQQGEDYDLVIESAARYSPQLKRTGAPAELRWLLERRVGALMAAGRFAEALAVADADEIGDTAAEHRVLALLALERPDDAIAFLEEWRRRPASDLRLVTRLQVRALREGGKFDEMDAALAELRKLSPADPAPLVYAVVQLAMAGRHEAAGRAFEDFLFRFGGSVESLAMLAAPLAEIRELDLLQRVTAAAKERGFPTQRFQVMLVQTHLQRGEWDAAARMLASVAPESGRDGAASEVWRDWTERLIDSARLPTDAAQTALLEFLRQRPWPLVVFRQSIEALARAGRAETAREGLALALRAFPASSWLQAQQKQAAEQLAGRATRAVSSNAPAAVRAMSEQAFVDRLDELLEAAEWGEATRHLQQIEALNPRPTWVDRREATVRLARVKIAHGQRDFPATVAAARIFLNTDETRARQALALARNCYNAGDQEYGVAITREVLARLPAFALAQRQLAGWGESATTKPVAQKAAPSAPGAAAKTKKQTPPAAVAKPTPVLDDPAEQLGQVRTRHTAGDFPGALRLARLYLNGDQARSLKMLELAREFFAAGDKKMAVTLTNEVLQRSPNFPPAKRLLAEWSPAAKK